MGRDEQRHPAGGGRILVAGARARALGVPRAGRDDELALGLVRVRAEVVAEQQREPPRRRLFGPDVQVHRALGVTADVQALGVEPRRMSDVLEGP